jgi:FkbM family methyltransferase
MSFNVDFLGKNLLLSEECKNVLGATRNMQIYEIDLINVFYNELLNKQDINDEIVLLDVGANTGAFCFLPIIDERIKTYAFEPNPLTHSILKENINLNNMNDFIKSFNMGLWSEKKNMDLKIPKDLTDSGLATFGETPTRFIYDNKNGEYITTNVECDTIDNIVEDLKLKTVTAIKIDTEGSELKILMGAEKTIKKHKPIILFEYFDGNTVQFGYKKEQLIKLLLEYGYTDFSYPTESDILVKK